MTVSINNAAALAACNAIVDLVDGGSAAGTMTIYSGSAPADVSTAISGQTVLAELTFSDPAFGNAADANPGGRATASAITSDTSANASGTATFFRIFDSDSNAVVQGDVSTVAAGTGDLQLVSTSITAGQTVSVSSLTFTVNEISS